MMDIRRGSLGILLSEVGEIIQSIASGLVDRGFDQEEITKKILSWAGSGYEVDWWERWGGPAMDELAYALGYDSAYPKDE